MTIVHNRHRPHHPYSFSGALPVVLVELVSSSVLLIRPCFFLSFLSSIFSRLSSLWISWVTVWGSVSDRILMDPLFARFSQALLRSFSMGERCQCVGVFRD